MISLFLAMSCLASAVPTNEDMDWAKQQLKKVNQQTKEHESWIKEHLKNEDKENESTKNQLREYVNNIPKIIAEEKLTQLSKGKCTGGQIKEEKQHSIFVFLSFSVPDETWISLSKELETYGGTIVLRGLPNNSFAELSKKLLRLTKQGVVAPVQINPTLFQKYAIQAVPSIVFADEEKFDKVIGNVSIAFSQRYAAEHGETVIARTAGRKQ